MHVFARFAPILHAQSVLSNKISASEISRKLVKSASLVGSAVSFIKATLFSLFPSLQRLLDLVGRHVPLGGGAAVAPAVLDGAAGGLRLADVALAPGNFFFFLEKKRDTRNYYICT